MTADDVMAELGISRSTLHRWIENEGFPKHQPAGPRGRRLFDRAEVDEFVRSRCIATGGES